MDITQEKLELTLLELFRDQKKHKCGEGIGFVIKKLGLPPFLKNDPQFVSKIANTNNALIGKNLIAGDPPSAKSRVITPKGLKVLEDNAPEHSSLVKTDQNNLSVPIENFIEAAPEIVKSATGLDNFLNSLKENPVVDKEDKETDGLSELFFAENIKAEKSIRRAENKVVKLICEALLKLCFDKYKTLVMELFNRMGYKSETESSEEIPYIELRDKGICKIYVYFDKGNIDTKVKASDLYSFTGAVSDKPCALVFVTQRTLEKDASAYIKKHGIEVFDIERVSKLMCEYEIGVKKKEISYIAEPDYKYFV